MNLTYLSKKKSKKAKKYFISRFKQIIEDSKNLFSINIALVGSSKRNLILIDETCKYDLDYQILITNFKNSDNPKQVKFYFINSFKKYFNNWKIENSTTAITLKNKDFEYSYDIIICSDIYNDDFKVIKKNDDGKDLYSWNQLKEYKEHRKIMKKINKLKLTNEIRKTYKYKKENNSENKKSYILHIESAKEVLEGK